MLLIETSEATGRQEAFMSSIHTDSETIRQAAAVRRGSDSFSIVRRVGVPKDQEDASAWSTATARTVTERTSVRRGEECPPEVYLG